MRLDPNTRVIIREEAARHFGPDAEVRLFGSRVRDEQRGGDIDLFIEAEGDHATLLRQELALFAALQMRLGEQRIDIVVHPKGAPLRPIDEVAKREGITL